MKRSLCADCERPMSVCYCHTLCHLQNTWPIHILQHPAERKHAIGTARIAQLSLSRCTLQVAEQVTLATLDTDPASLDTLLVYPGEDSVPLASLTFNVPQRLLFIDASWRKSRRMLAESPEIMALPKVSLSPDTLSRYKIRKVPNPSALSTLEAIVSALSLVEDGGEKGDAVVPYAQMLDTMDWMINKQIECMGQAVFERNYADRL